MPPPARAPAINAENVEASALAILAAQLLCDETAYTQSAHYQRRCVLHPPARCGEAKLGAMGSWRFRTYLGELSGQLFDKRSLATARRACQDNHACLPPGVFAPVHDCPAAHHGPRRDTQGDTIDCW